MLHVSKRRKKQSTINCLDLSKLKNKHRTHNSTCPPCLSTSRDNCLFPHRALVGRYNITTPHLRQDFEVLVKMWSITREPSMFSFIIVEVRQFLLLFFVLKNKLKKYHHHFFVFLHVFHYGIRPVLSGFVVPHT